MASIPVWLYVSIVFFSLSAIILVFAPFLWYKFRHARVIKARTTIIDLIYWITGTVALIISVLRSMNAAYNANIFPCGEGILVAYLFNLFSLCAIYKCYKLFFIYHFTKQRLRYQIEEGNNTTRSVWYKIISNQEILSDKYNLIAFSIVALFFWIFPIANYINAVVVYSPGDYEPYCSSKIYFNINLIPHCIKLATVVYIAIQLRHTHDAYWMKYELFIAVIGSITLQTVGLGIITYNAGVTQLLYAISIFIQCVTGFAIPIGLGWKENNLESETASYIETSDSVSLKLAGSSNSHLGFNDHPKIASLLSKTEVYQFLEDFLADTQDINLSHWFLLWCNLFKWREIEDKTAMLSKAFIIYQKFLAPESYIKVDVPVDLSKKVGEIVEKNMKNFSDGQEGESVPKELFDEIIHEAEDKLASELFKPFFKSRFYVEYKKTTSVLDLTAEQV